MSACFYIPPQSCTTIPVLFATIVIRAFSHLPSLFQTCNWWLLQWTHCSAQDRRDVPKWIGHHWWLQYSREWRHWSAFSMTRLYSGIIQLSAGGIRPDSPAVQNTGPDDNMIWLSANRMHSWSAESHLRSCLGCLSISICAVRRTLDIQFLSSVEKDWSYGGS